MAKNHKNVIQEITLSVILFQLILNYNATLLQIIVAIKMDILVILIMFVYEKFKPQNNSNHLPKVRPVMKQKPIND